MDRNVVLSPGHAVGEGVWLSVKAKLYRLAGARVFLDPSSQLKANPEAWDFLFAKNPWVAGEKEAVEGDCIDGVSILANPHRRIVHDPGFLRAAMFSMQERVASLAYVPRKLPALSGVVVVDLNISSYRLRPGGRDDFSHVGEFVASRYPDALALIREDYDVSPRSFEPLPAASLLQPLVYKTIYDYADIANSCERIACLQTGSELIACAYAQKVDCLRTEAHDACPSDPSRRLQFFPCEVRDFDLRSGSNGI